MGESFMPIAPPRQRCCLWCQQPFAIRDGGGRKRIYCKQSCRQRAYERRRGLGVVPPPERLIMRPGGPLAELPNRWKNYESGGHSWARGKLHALRPAGYADAGERRATLCGIKRAPNPARGGFLPAPAGTTRADDHHTCMTCSMIARLRPPGRSVRPSSDLAAYRAQLDAVACSLAADPSPATAVELLQELIAA